MASLDLALRDFKAAASRIKDQESLTITELADGYCKAIDGNKSDLANEYFSALVLRFWWKIQKAYTKNKAALRVSKEDCYDWLISSIMMACDKSARIWQKNSNINAQQAINQVFSTRFEKMAYYESNLLKNKGAHVTCSLDEPIGNQDDDKGHSIGDFIADEANEIEKEGDVTSFIQSLLDKDKVVEAIIFDNIADPDKDVFKYKKKTIKTTNADGEKVKYTKHTSEFWEFKLMKELNELDGNYKNYFLAKYKVSTGAVNAALDVIARANNQKKYRMLRAALKRERPTFAEYCTM